MNQRQKQKPQTIPIITTQGTKQKDTENGREKDGYRADMTRVRKKGFKSFPITDKPSRDWRLVVQ